MALNRPSIKCNTKIFKETYGYSEWTQNGSTKAMTAPAYFPT